MSSFVCQSISKGRTHLPVTFKTFCVFFSKLCKLCGVEKLVTKLFAIRLNSRRHVLTSIERYVEQSRRSFIMTSRDQLTFIDVEVSGKCKYFIDSCVCSLIAYLTKIKFTTIRLSYFIGNPPEYYCLT